NKAKLIVTGTMEKPIIGLYGKEDLDQGRELLNCPLHVPTINEILDYIREFITISKLIPYNVSSKVGELKGLIIFHSQSSNETYLRFIMRSKESVDRIKKNAPLLQKRFPHLKCISV